MEQNVTDQLVKFLRSQKEGFIALSDSNQEFKKLKKQLEQLGLKGDLKKAIGPYLGDVLMLKRSRPTYLVFKQTDEDLLFRVVQSRSGKAPGTVANKIPFTKNEFLTVLNRLLEQGRVRALKFNDKYVPVLYPVESVPFPSMASEHKNDVSEEKFKEAYSALEQGKFYVRICDMRRRLNWPSREFDMMLIELRDAGQLQLQDGDTDFFTKEDIRDSFVDENGFRMLTMAWRQK
ncbi:MAG: hypothetical protein LBS00_10575 [Synergistaceae bacterium]|jgi:hypothetical protein|nr:hypothetical protein [Synergistaceae bacterium]